jgi:SulP family sulfate permease
MAEIETFKHLLQGPLGDRAVLLLTFALTVMFDLTVAIEVGLVLAAFLFMHRMSEMVAMKSDVSLVEEDADDFSRTAEPSQRARLTQGVEVPAQRHRARGRCEMLCTSLSRAGAEEARVRRA